MTSNMGPLRPTNPAPPKPLVEGTTFDHVYFGDDKKIIRQPQFFKNRVQHAESGRIGRIEGAVHLHPRPLPLDSDYRPASFTVEQNGQLKTYRYFDLDLFKKVKDQIPDNKSLPNFQSTDEVQDYFFNPSRFG